MKYFDIPFIESQWLRLMQRQIKKTIASKTKYKSVFGKYFSLMKLKAYKSYGFSDSPFLNYDFKKNKSLREMLLSNDINEYLNILIDK